MKLISIWLDNDVQRRIPPAPYNVWFQKEFDKMAEYVIANAYRIENISFDNDLGVKLEGHHIAREIYERIHEKRILFPRLRTITAHTGNVVAAERIISYFKRLNDLEKIQCKVIRQEYRPSGVFGFKGTII